MSACTNGGDVQPGLPLVCRHAGVLLYVKDVELVVGNASAFLEGQLGRANIHAAIELHGIGVDDLAVKSPGQVEGKT